MRRESFPGITVADARLAKRRPQTSLRHLILVFIMISAIGFLVTVFVLHNITPSVHSGTGAQTVEQAYRRAEEEASQKAEARRLSSRFASVAKSTMASVSGAVSRSGALVGMARNASSSLRNLVRRGKHTRATAAALCYDLNENCKQWSSQGECESNPNCAPTLSQAHTPPASWPSSLPRAHHATSLSRCACECPRAVRWAVCGVRCAVRADMRLNCPKSCNSCLDGLKRSQLCHRTRQRRPLLRRGGISGTFERVVEQMTHEKYAVNVLSRPPQGPWVITIDDFLAEHEIRALLEKGGHHYERSLAGDGVSPVRTSSTSWCNVPFCEGDPTIKSLKRRVANVTGVPLTHSEHVQVLRYEVGDFYRQHHDQNAHPHSPWGPRLYTFFLYLSDVPGGGGTRFTRLNITVEAKRGRALFWPSVLDTDPSGVRTSSDQRTTHEALTVTKGQKFAANMWLHQFDFQSALGAGCKNEDQAEWKPTDPAHADEEPPPLLADVDELDEGDPSETRVLNKV
jgi:prolyl 4-hydroxylase